MTDKFNIIPLTDLLQIILNQINYSDFVLSVPKSLFFYPSDKKHLQIERYGQLLETPIGVAAGPHTQMAQNIVAAWLTGARYIELKTIQTLDELEISKPCIDMQDEGYNCEWSQELKIRQSFDQYLNAWIIIHILKHKLGMDTSQRGFIFNMSVGYDFAGIQNENVQWFFKKMQDANIELQQKLKAIKHIYPAVKELNIETCLSDNITLSTMHGCLPEEIEQIGEYLLSEKKLHTAIKLNPTLLGKEQLLKIIDNSGFETQVPDIAFEHDLKYPDALNIIKKLQQTAAENKREFGLKLTNTLESLNNKNVFPEKEKMMYASGKVLHPISVNVARKLQNDFNGNLDISFSAGIDAANVQDVVSCGMYPVTVCSDILKPGGYGKLYQYLENIQKIPTAKNGKENLNKLRIYADKVLEDKRYKKPAFKDPSIKTTRKLDTFDCIHAPCVDTCPTNQGIPDYMYYTAQGDFEKAFEVMPDAIVTTEVGQNQMWAAQYFKVKYPNQFITSGGLGTMGFGFPAAIGAQVACPDKVVIDIAGDGSFLMNIQELATCVFYNIPVKVLILNNGYLGMVRQWQQLFYKERYSATCIGCKDTSFEEIAKGFGAVGMTVEKPS